jgi:hypothetical protein
MIEKGRFLNLCSSISIVNYILLLVIISLFWIYKRHGFDLTDEAFYAISSTQPENINSNLTSFGYLTNYVIRFFNCDFHTTRIFGLFLILVTWSLVCLKVIRDTKENISKKELAVQFPCLVLPVLIFYWDGIYSLNYNLYAVCGLNLILYGLYSSEDIRLGFKGILIGSFGVFVCLMSKFTVIPCLLGLCCIFSLVKKSKLELKYITYIIAVSPFFFALHFFFSQDNLFLFLERHNHAFNNLHLLKSEHLIFFNDISILDTFYRILTFSSPAYSFIVLVIIVNFIIVHKYRHLKTLNIPVALLLSLSLLIVYKSHTPNRWSLNYQLLFYSIYSAAFLVTYNSKIDNPLFNDRFKYILAAPLLISLGSSDSITYLGSKCVFYLIFLLGIYLLSKNKKTTILSSFFFIFSTSLTISMMFFGFKHPYRTHGRINQQNTKITTIDTKHNFIVNEDLGIFLTQIKKTALNNNWKKNTSLINLTNKPGITFCLSAKIITVPWLLGAYDGSDNWVVSMINRYQKFHNINESWIITNDDPHNKLTTNILDRIDLDLSANYQKIEIPNMHGYYAGYTIWKPITKQ